MCLQRKLIKYVQKRKREKIIKYKENTRSREMLHGRVRSSFLSSFFLIFKNQLLAHKRN